LYENKNFKIKKIKIKIHIIKNEKMISLIFFLFFKLFLLKNFKYISNILKPIKYNNKILLFHLFWKNFKII